MQVLRNSILAAIVLICSPALAGFLVDEDEKKWIEGKVTLPAYPQDADLLEFYVSAATANRFFIDGKSLSVGEDGVVRYALVVRTSGGAINASFEGIRCSKYEVKLYATGHADRTWAPARIVEWRRIENKAVNRHHAALWRDYFCPGGIAISGSVAARDALRRGVRLQEN